MNQNVYLMPPRLKKTTLRQNLKNDKGLTMEKRRRRHFRREEQGQKHVGQGEGAVIMKITEAQSVGGGREGS